MTDTTMHAGHVSSGTHGHHGGTRSYKRFFGHFGEMFLAMMVGMAVGGMLGVSRIGVTELKAVAWLVAMTAPMVAWMLFRGMSWRQSVEMSVAMAVPTLFALGAFWAGLIPPKTVNSIEHGWMVPAMLALMVVRRKEYGL